MSAALQGLAVMVTRPALPAVRLCELIRAAGGRELLAETLRTRGAELCYAEVYRRLEPNTDLDALRAAHSRIDLIVVTSNDGLRNHVSMAGERHRRWLLDTPLAVIRPRTAELAVEMGFVHPAAVAYTAADEALLATILAWRSTLSANKERT